MRACEYCGTEITGGPCKRFCDHSCQRKMPAQRAARRARERGRPYDREKEAIRKKVRYLRNAEEVKAQSKAWKEANRERDREWKRHNYATNPHSRKLDLARSRERQSNWQRLAALFKVEAIITNTEKAMSDTNGTKSHDDRQKELEKFQQKAHKLTTEKLQEEYSLGLRIVRDKLLWTACVLGELDKRGLTVEGDRFFMKLLRSIATGKLLVDVVVRFAGRPVTMAAVAGMEPEQQQEIMEMTDEQVEERVRAAKPPRTQKQRQASAMPSLIEAAGNADPKDIAEMCASLVCASKDPEQSARLSIAELNRLLIMAQRKPA